MTGTEENVPTDTCLVTVITFHNSKLTASDFRFLLRRRDVTYANMIPQTSQTSCDIPPPPVRKRNSIKGSTSADHCRAQASYDYKL